MKLMIEIDDFIAKGIRGENDCKVKPGEIVRVFQTTIAEAIKNGTPSYFLLPEDVFYKITDAEWEHSDSFWVTTPSGKKIEFEKKRPQAEWIRTGSLGNGNAQYECSNCHHGDEHAESQEVPYCWHCGAKMMKAREDNEDS